MQWGYVIVPFPSKRSVHHVGSSNHFVPQFFRCYGGLLSGSMLAHSKCKFENTNILSDICLIFFMLIMLYLLSKAWSVFLLAQSNTVLSIKTKLGVTNTILKCMSKTTNKVFLNQVENPLFLFPGCSFYKIMLSTIVTKRKLHFFQKKTFSVSRTWRTLVPLLYAGKAFHLLRVHTQQYSRHVRLKPHWTRNSKTTAK